MGEGFPVREKPSIQKGKGFPVRKKPSIQGGEGFSVRKKPSIQGGLGFPVREMTWFWNARALWLLRSPISRKLWEESSSQIPLLKTISW